MTMQIKFELMVYCTTGWDDDESTALLEVHTFDEIVQAASILNKDIHNRSESEQELYTGYRNRLETENGEDLSYVGEVVGIRCVYDNGKGISAVISLDDEKGADGRVKVNSQEHANEYKTLLAKAKSLAADIAYL